MSDLSPRARAFLDARADEGLPSAADRARVRAAALAAIAPQTPAAQKPATTSPAAGLAKLAVGLLVSGGLIAGLAQWTRHDGQPSAVPEAPTPSVAPAPPTPTTAVEALPTAPATRVANNTPQAVTRKTRLGAPVEVAHDAPAPSTPAPAEGQELDPAEEFRVLAQAQASTRAGNPAWALELLDQHQRQFGPKALLQEEAIAARVMALCGLGQKTEALAAASRLRSLNSASVHLAKVERACW